MNKRSTLCDFGFNAPKRAAPPIKQSSFRLGVEKAASPATKPANSSSSRLRLDDDEAQYVLDAGQKSFGPIQCAECLMFYTPDMRSDVRAHDQYHRRKLDARFMYRCCELPASYVSELRTKGCLVKETLSELHVQVTSVCRHRLRDRVHQVFNEVINHQLGFIPTTGPLLNTDRQCFLLITKIAAAKYRLIGFVLVEKITSAELVPGDATSSATEVESDCDHPVDDDENEIQQPETQRHQRVSAQLGVNRVWVHPEHRRQAVASRLLDSARQHFYLGQCIGTHRLAFSDPTDAGRALALAYCQQLLVYKMS